MNSGFFYKTAGEREGLVKAERAFTDDKVTHTLAENFKICKFKICKFIMHYDLICWLILNIYRSDRSLS